LRLEGNGASPPAQLAPIRIEGIILENIEQIQPLCATALRPR
jgi:hypothetical protein